MHSTSPGRTVKLTPLTACTVASRLTNRTVRSLTSASGAPPLIAASSMLQRRLVRPAVARAGVEHVASAHMGAGDILRCERGFAGTAHSLGERTARVEAATGGRVD